MNEIYIYKNNYALMLIKHKGEYYRVYFDVEDIELVQKYKWSISNTGYVYCSTEDILLHRLLMQDEINKLEGTGVVDHISHNTLDNTRKNLRVVTYSDNNRNRDNTDLGKSGVSNIRWRKDRGMWKVEFKGKGAKSFKNFFDAFEFRNKRAMELYGESAFLQKEIEIYTTTNLQEVGLLEANGFHYIICTSSEICDTFVYVYSHKLKELLGHIEE